MEGGIDSSCLETSIGFGPTNDVQPKWMAVLITRCMPVEETPNGLKLARYSFFT